MNKKSSCFEGYAKGDPLLEEYHDSEWGSPTHDEQVLIEMFILELFQAGLSWKTILHKRESFRTALDYFDIQEISKYTDQKVNALMQNPDIIRNHLKINAVINNAKIMIEIQKEYGAFSQYLWHFTDNQTIYEDPSITRDELSDDVSKDMKKRGMQFAGSVTIYSFLQSVGIIYSHPKTCYRFKEDKASKYYHNRYREGKVYQV